MLFNILCRDLLCGFSPLLGKSIESGIFVWMLCLIGGEHAFFFGGGGGGGGGAIFLWPLNWFKISSFGKYNMKIGGVKELIFHVSLVDSGVAWGNF